MHSGSTGDEAKGTSMRTRNSLSSRWSCQFPLFLMRAERKNPTQGSVEIRSGFFGVVCMCLKRLFAQLLSGLETGHPVTFGQSPAYFKAQTKGRRERKRKGITCIWSQSYRQAESCFSCVLFKLLGVRFIGFGSSKLKLEHFSSEKVFEKKRGHSWTAKKLRFLNPKCL